MRNALKASGPWECGSIVERRHRRVRCRIVSWILRPRSPLQTWSSLDGSPGYPERGREGTGETDMRFSFSPQDLRGP